MRISKYDFLIAGVTSYTLSDSGVCLKKASTNVDYQNNNGGCGEFFQKHEY